MCVYSALLIALNRRHLMAPLRPSPARVAVLVWSTVFYGWLAALTILQQLRRLAE